MLKSLISIFQITGLQVNKAKLLIDNFSLFTFLSIELEIRLFCIDIYANDCIKKNPIMDLRYMFGTFQTNY